MSKSTDAYRYEPAPGGSSSAMSLHEYPEETDELPPYTDLDEPIPISYHAAPAIPTSISSSNNTTIYTQWPEYSNDPLALETMIKEQSNYPPTYTLRVQGTHTESRKTRDNKKESQTVTDFDVKLDMTHLLMCPNPIHRTNPSPCPDCHHLKLLQDGEKGYRGNVLQSTSPHHEDLSSWCAAFVTSVPKTKTFTLTRTVTAHNTSVLSAAITQLVGSTSYRGNLQISFPITNSKITVYSSSRLNALRFNKWICWFFYLTFLWLFSWPVLWLVTKNYAPVTAEFSYRKPHGGPLVKSETAFFEDWKLSLRRAVLARHQGWIDAAYRAETAQMGCETGGLTTMDLHSAANFAAGIVRVATGSQIQVGWGANS